MVRFLAVLLISLSIASVCYAEPGDILLSTPETQPSITNVRMTSIEMDGTSMIVRYAVVDGSGNVISRGQEMWEGDAFTSLKTYNITLGQVGDPLMGTFKRKVGQALKVRLSKNGTIE